MTLIPLLFSWLLCVCSCIRKCGTKWGEFFCDKKWQKKNSPCFLHKNTLLACNFQWTWREWEVKLGRVKNGPAFLPCASEFGDLHTSQIWAKLCAFYHEVATGQLDEWSGHLAFKGWCSNQIIRTTVIGEFWWIRLSGCVPIMVIHIFCAL